MRVMIFADPHWSSYSSIVRGRGEKYSTRLENLISTMNWIEEEAYRQQCDVIICLGDFFDKSELNSEEITALQEVKWSNIPHYFLAGNHEIGRGSLEFSSAHLFNLCPASTTICEVCSITADEHTEIVFLPYILDIHRNPLYDYLKPYLNNGKDIIIMSHNDIKGVQMGVYESTIGFEKEEIEEHCRLFINGHLHNTYCVGDKIINLGNITGQNFGEDAFTYPHHCMILDTGVSQITYIENPYALKFYKFHFNQNCSNDEINSALDKIGSNAVVMIKAPLNKVEDIKRALSECDKVVESRLLIDMSTQDDEAKTADDYLDLSINHINKFVEYVRSAVGSSDLILDELNYVVGNAE